MVNDCGSTLEIVKLPKGEEWFLLILSARRVCSLPFTFCLNRDSFLSPSSCLRSVSLPLASPVMVPSQMPPKVSFIRRMLPKEGGRADSRDLGCAAHAQGKWHSRASIWQGQRVRVGAGRTAGEGPSLDSQRDSRE